MGIVDSNGNDIQAEDNLDPRLRCIGKFAIPRRIIQMNFDDMLELMKDMIIVRAELMMVTDTVEYHAISPKYFEEIDPGVVPPTYAIQRLPNETFLVTRQD